MFRFNFALFSKSRNHIRDRPEAHYFGFLLGIQTKDFTQGKYFKKTKKQAFKRKNRKICLI